MPQWPMWPSGPAASAGRAAQRALLPMHAQPRHNTPNKMTGAAAATGPGQAQTLSSLHRDYVHSIAFDHYGRRFATCSGDRTVRVWDASGDTWSSAPGSEWQAHRGSVTQISWAHPEFGQLLATCGSDHAATVWEERVGGLGLPGAQSAEATGTGTSGAAAAGNQPATRWVNKAQLTDARKAVTCVQFAPRHLGLKLATGSADGIVRIYEAIDVANLNHWPMNGSIDAEVGGKGGELGVTSLSWCGGRFEPPTLVVGGSSGAVSVYRYSDASRAWNLIVSLPKHDRGVLDVSWAPNVGRSYHLIASCGQDNVLRIHRLKRGTSADGQQKTTASLELESSQVLNTGGAEVWRCEWNVTGTVLASSGDGGVVQLWKSDYRKDWTCVSEVHGDTQGGAAVAAATKMMS